MSIDFQHLKALTLAATERTHPDHVDAVRQFSASCSPQLVASLLAEIDRYRAIVAADAREFVNLRNIEAGSRTALQSVAGTVAAVTTCVQEANAIAECPLREPAKYFKTFQAFDYNQFVRVSHLVSAECFDQVGETCKHVERQYLEAAEIPQDKHIIIRLDGRSFSKLTERMQKPFDPIFAAAMAHTAKRLIEDGVPGAMLAYTQSDEITLLIPKLGVAEGTHPFAGRIQKLITLASAHASVVFNNFMAPTMPATSHGRILATFDARAYGVSTLDEAMHHIAWRQVDCVRNGINAICRWRYPLQNVDHMGSMQRLHLIESLGTNVFDDFPAQNVSGLFVHKTSRHVSREELLKKGDIPEQYVPDNGCVRKVVVPIGQPVYMLDYLMHGAPHTSADLIRRLLPLIC